MLIFQIRLLLFFCLLLFGHITLPGILYSQTDTVKTARTKPVTPHTKLIKYSEATVKNNLYYPGKVNGFLNGNSTFIRDFEAQEAFSFETGNYDSIQFYYDLPYSYVDKFFIRVLDNEPFTFEPVPVQEVNGIEMVIDNVKRLKGKKLYEVTITDDDNPGQIEVAATKESSPYIDVLKIDTAIYQIKLKGNYEFSRDVSPEVQEKIRKGEEVIFPIGIVMTNKNMMSDVQEYKIFLKKKKKPKVKRY